jgi:DNA-binding protein Fis
MWVTITVTYYVRDFNGNVSSTLVNIIIKDVTAPSFETTINNTILIR